MKKRVLLIGYNFHPELTGIGKYSGEMMYWLANNGYDCSVITSYPYYPHWKIQHPYTKQRFWYKTEREQFQSGGRLTIYRCPMYVPAKPSGLKRILSDFSFLATAICKVIQLISHSKFDFVCVVAPSFQFGLLGILYKKFRKSEFLYHIQDMQIEAARELQLIKSKQLINFLFKIEKYIFDKADNISSISLTMTQKIQSKANKKIIIFPNWVDTKIFYPIKNRAVLKEKFGFNSFDKIILYSGAIGEKQGLDAILKSAQIYKNQKNLKFIICGSGPYKQKLHIIANSLNLSNVVFFPLQPFDKFNEFLNIADVHLVIQKATASDLVMPSKLTTILAVGGLALITADKQSDLYSLITQFNMGLVVEPENQEALNNAIIQAIANDKQILMNNARTYAEDFLSIDSVMQKFKRDINL
ncbi:WcaI family glycosyltransferase [Hymenobacter sp. RP-2-7]|uniref:WcaI family glycosyltransferase n=1 Tax=Hymenobacter polaris TaxID=2682546 RepID=A0A7Y0AAA3_9BACT|nr:WcaI family glycosyltransferase [Hymenobacter polaris]NML63638.1 WcaI family glycosyltransferase [Hymenobacter polaris]